MNGNPLLFINSYSEVNNNKRKSIYITNSKIDYNKLVIKQKYVILLKNNEVIKGTLMRINNDSIVIINKDTSITINKNNVNKINNY